MKLKHLFNLLDEPFRFHEILNASGAILLFACLHSLNPYTQIQPKKIEREREREREKKKSIVWRKKIIRLV